MKPSILYPLLALLLGLLPLVVTAQDVSRTTQPLAGPAELGARLRELQDLLGQIEALESQLLEQVQEAQAHAEAAGDYDTRARYESLAAQTGARLAELRASRRDLEEQMQRLARALRSFKQDRIY